jgi:hypothetical protein
MALQPTPASYSVCITGSLPAGMKLPMHDADHLPPPYAKLKNMWSYNSTPSYAFMVYEAMTLPLHLSYNILPKSALHHETKLMLVQNNVTDFFRTLH